MEALELVDFCLRMTPVLLRRSSALAVIRTKILRGIKRTWPIVLKAESRLIGPQTKFNACNNAMIFLIQNLHVRDSLPGSACTPYVVPQQNDTTEAQIAKVHQVRTRDFGFEVKNVEEQEDEKFVPHHRNYMHGAVSGVNGSVDRFDRSGDQHTRVYASTLHAVRNRRDLLNRSRSRLRSKHFDASTALSCPATEFYGVMVDSGSAASVSSPAQLYAYCKLTGYVAPLTAVAQSVLQSMYGSARVHGKTSVRFPVCNGFLAFTAKVSDGDCPMILGFFCSISVELVRSIL